MEYIAEAGVLQTGNANFLMTKNFQQISNDTRSSYLLNDLTQSKDKL